MIFLHQLMTYTVRYATADDVQLTSLSVTFFRVLFGVSIDFL